MWPISAKLWNTHRDEAALLLTTFLLTAFMGMVNGIASGVVLSLTLTLYRTSRPHTAELGWIGGVYRNLNRFPQAVKAPGQLLVRYDGPLNYASQSHFKDYILSRIDIREAKGDPIHRGPQRQVHSLPGCLGFGHAGGLARRIRGQRHPFHWAGAIGPVRDGLKSPD